METYFKKQMIKTVKLAGFMSKRNHTWARLGTAWSEGGGHPQSAQISLLSLCVWVSSCLSHLFNANREFDQEVQRDVKVNLWQKKRKNKDIVFLKRLLDIFSLEDWWFWFCLMGDDCRICDLGLKNKDGFERIWFGVFTYSDFVGALYGCLNGSLCTHFMKHRLMCSAVQKTWAHLVLCILL